MIEQDIRESLAQRASEVTPPENSWTEIASRVKRARRARTMTFAVSGMALMSAIALVVTTAGGQRQAIADFAGEAIDAGTVRIVSRNQVAVGKHMERFEAVTVTDFRRRVSHTIQKGPGESKTETIVTAQYAYMRFPFFGMGELPPGKRWARAPLDSAFPIASASSSAWDPAAFLHRLQQHGSLVRKGRQVIRGVATTHYEGVLSGEFLKAEALEQASPEVRETIRTQEVRDQLFELWIGDDGLPYRAVQRITTPGNGESFDQVHTATADFLDYGKPVSIGVPPAKDVLVVDNFWSLFKGDRTVSTFSCTSDAGDDACTSDPARPEPSSGFSTFSCTVDSTGATKGDC